MSIDCHVHLFVKGQAGVSKPRHVPQYDATLETLVGLALSERVTKFVLVQTSFMGTNNEYLMKHIVAFPDQLRGVFILDPLTSAAELRDLKNAGVVGIRLNLFGTDLSDTLDKSQLRFIERCSAEGLSVGIHDDASRLLPILKTIGTRASKLVIDHFGRPESLPGAQDDPVYAQLIEEMAKLNAYVKISAPYRAPQMDSAKAFEMLLKALGQDRLLWASDWPWTQSERYLTYHHWANAFCENDSEPNLPQLLAPNARSFYEFD